MWLDRTLKQFTSDQMPNSSVEPCNGLFD